MTRIENMKKPKVTYLLEKILILSIACSKRKNKDEKIIE